MQILLDHMGFSYEKNRTILEDITIAAEKGESIGLIGCNGVGKSTLLKVLAGIELGFTGQVFLFGQEMKKKNLHEIRRRTGYVFQNSDHQLFMPTVYEDVAFAPRNYGFSEQEVQKRTEEALEKVHIADTADRKIYQLSGGQKKLAAIATVLPLHPELLLLDEPSAALDPCNRRNLIHVLNELDQTKIITSHDLDFIYDTCERTILLFGGRIVADGDTKEILKNRELLENHGLELPLSFSR